MMQNAPNDTSGSSGDSSTGSIVTEQVKQGAQQVAQQTQETAGKVAEGAKHQAMSYADTQKHQATQSLHSVAQALQQTGSQLQTQNQGTVGNLANTAADKIDGFAGYLEQTPVQQLVQDAEDYARQHSTVFLAGAALLGFAAARFLKASKPSYSASGNSYSGSYGTGRAIYGSGGVTQYQSGFDTERTDGTTI